MQLSALSRQVLLLSTLFLDSRFFNIFFVMLFAKIKKLDFFLIFFFVNGFIIFICFGLFNVERLTVAAVVSVKKRGTFIEKKRRFVGSTGRPAGLARTAHS